MTSHPLRASAILGGVLLGLFLIGCESDSSQTAVQDNQDRALKDPFNYGPSGNDLMKPGEDDQLDRTNISGGGIGNYDKKGMKRDLDSVFGP